MKFLAHLNGLFGNYSNGSQANDDKHEEPGGLRHFHDGLHNNFAYKWAESSYTDEKANLIIREYLKSDSDCSLSTAVESITALLPKHAPLSEDIATCGELILELAEELPYQASSHQKLVRLLAALGDTLAFTEILSDGRVNRFQRLGESMVENWNSVEPLEENPGAFVNWNAFVARLYEARIFQPDGSFALWTMRDALEEDLSEMDKDIRSSWILGAAQWILWHGRTLFDQIAPSTVSKVKPIYHSEWSGGALYHGNSNLSLERWRFWKESFREISKGSEVTEECKDMAAQAAKLMDAYESILGY